MSNKYATTAVWALPVCFRRHRYYKFPRRNWCV